MADRENKLAQELRRAVKKNNIEACKAAIGKGADVNSILSGRSILNEACTNENVEIAKVLVGAGAAVVDCRMIDPLTLSSDRGDVEMCRFLISAGADPRQAGPRGGSAFITAALSRKLDVCEVLLEAGADINALNVDLLTALFVAARRNEVAVCRFLIQRGADQSPRMPVYPYKELGPITPFQMAVTYGSEDVVQFYVNELGEDAAQRTESGLSMMELAGSHPATLAIIASSETVAQVERELVASCDPALARSRTLSPL